VFTAGLMFVVVGLALLILGGYTIVRQIEVSGLFSGKGSRGDGSASVKAGGSLGLIGLGLAAMLMGVFILWLNSGRAASVAVGSASNGTIPTPPITSGTNGPRSPAPSATLGPPPYTLTATDDSMRVVIESEAVDKRSGLLTYHARVENNSTTDTVYLNASNVLAVDRHDQSYGISPDASTLAASIDAAIEPGATRVGTLILSQRLPADDTGTLLQLRLGFGLGSLTTWSFDTLVPAAS